MKALLAMEDNEWREVFQGILEQETSELIIIEDALKTTDLFHRYSFDIIVIDESLKRGSPAEVVMNIKDILKRLPVTIVSGNRLSKYDKIWNHCGVAFVGSRLQAIKYLPWAIKDAQSQRRASVG